MNKLNDEQVQKTTKKIQDIVENYIKKHPNLIKHKEDLIQECWVARMEMKSYDEAIAKYMKRFRR